MTALALRAKTHWGYDDAFMARAARELCCDEDDLRVTLAHVVERDGRVLCFAACGPTLRRLVIGT